VVRRRKSAAIIRSDGSFNATASAGGRWQQSPRQPYDDAGGVRQQVKYVALPPSCGFLGKFDACSGRQQTQANRPAPTRIGAEAKNGQQHEPPGVLGLVPHEPHFIREPVCRNKREGYNAGEAKPKGQPHGKGPMQEMQHGGSRNTKAFRGRLLDGLSVGSPTWTRTRDLRINSPSLYRLSYQGTASNYSAVLIDFGGALNFFNPCSIENR
jgi:hypothetical protein